MRQIQQALGLRSVSTVAEHVKRLRSLGSFPSEGGRRNLRLAEPNPQPTGGVFAEEIPFLGFFSLGAGIETLPVPKTFLAPPGLLETGCPVYALQVRGDELLEEGILDGDLLLVAVGMVPASGQGALLRDGKEWWLRRVEPAGEFLCLESITHRAAPVFRSAEHIEIFGVLLALWRDLGDRA
jgi:repressor LexA